jgi:hypothetical protein
VLGPIGWVLQAGTAADAQLSSLPDRLAASEGKLARLTLDAATNEVVITGANLRILSGLGFTDTMSGRGILVMGYNEPREGWENRRTGSHKVTVGKQHTQFLHLRRVGGRPPERG